MTWNSLRTFRWQVTEVCGKPSGPSRVASQLEAPQLRIHKSEPMLIFLWTNKSSGTKWWRTGAAVPSGCSIDNSRRPYGHRYIDRPDLARDRDPHQNLYELH